MPFPFESGSGVCNLTYWPLNWMTSSLSAEISGRKQPVQQSADSLIRLPGACYCRNNMVRRCAFPKCYNKMTKWSKVSFHRLPCKHRDLLKLWLVSLEIDPDTPVGTLKRMDYRVCSAHFSPQDYFPLKTKEGRQVQHVTLDIRKNPVPKPAKAPKVVHF